MSEKKLSVLFLSSWYPNRLLPKLGIFVQKHAEAVALLSNVAALHVCSDNSCKQRFEVEEATINSVFTVNVYYKKPLHKIPVLSEIQRIIRYIKAHFIGLKRISNGVGKIDLVHLNVLYPAGIIAWYLKRVRTIPYLITEHWTGYQPSKKVQISFVQRIISKIIVRNASCIALGSKDLEMEMRKSGLEANYELLYNAVDVDVFQPAAFKKVGSKVKLIHISSLDDAHKNVSGMLRAVTKLSESRSDFEMWFVGDCFSKPYADTAKTLSVFNTLVFFDGIKSTEEVAEIMKNADCFVMFSNYENLPCVMLEAFASGLPIVSSSVGGIPEHVNRDRGILVKAGDEQALVEALDSVIDDCWQSVYDTDSIREYAESNFSYEKITERAHQLYWQILDRSGH